MATKTVQKKTASKTAKRVKENGSSTKKTAKKNAFSKAQYVEWYRQMQLMRKFEELCGHLYIQQKFGGFCHLYIGQEAVAAGMVSAMDKDDNVITAYRDHGFPLAMGTDPNLVMAELYGKQTGLSKGKGGSMHMFDMEYNLFGGHGIVGAQIPMGAGIAFADRYLDRKRVTYCFMGDGAVRQGAFHETMNMAMMWDLPVVMVIENNNYAMGTSVKRSTNVEDLSKLGLSYDMPSESVDGMSVEAVHDAFKRAADRARKGGGPTLLNIETYRYKGHSMSDPQKYRTKEEVEQYKAVDPIQQVLKTITDSKYATKKQIEAIDEKIKKQVDESVKFAEESPMPEPHELYEDVYVNSDYPFVRD